MLDLLPLVNKTASLRFKGADLSLELSHALFSSFEIDVGTRLLLKLVGRDEVLEGATRVLDEGSGVGVIGLAVAKALPGAAVLARDRDLLGRAFTERNRIRNKVRNLRAEAGLLSTGSAGERPPAPGSRGAAAKPGNGAAAALGAATLGVAGPFDYILSNIPAKAGAPVIAAFFRRARESLAPGGRIAVVIVKPLVEAARTWIAEAGLEILVEDRGSMHAAFILALRPDAPPAAPPAPLAPPAPTREPPPLPVADGLSGGTAPQDGPAHAPEVDSAPLLDLSSVDLGVYARTEGSFTLYGEKIRARGYWGLPDFDTIGYAQSLGCILLERAAGGLLVRDALVINPGVGHLALLLARRFAPERLDAASRDILSLAATGANLAAARGGRAGPAYRALDLLRLDELEAARYDLIVEFPDIIPEYDGQAVLWERAARLLKSGGSLVAVSGPTELQRLEKRRPAGFRLLGEKRRKGFGGAAWRRE